jgi:hypothetical protein
MNNRSTEKSHNKGSWKTSILKTLKEVPISKLINEQAIRMLPTKL